MLRAAFISRRQLLSEPLSALLKALYERLFSWIVGRINHVIQVKDYNPVLHGKNTVIGVLDIYGFEIFDNNRLVPSFFTAAFSSLRVLGQH